MMDLVKSAKARKGNGKKKSKWTLNQLLASFYLIDQGQEPKEFASIVEHPASSIEYKTGRWMSENEITTTELLFKNFGVKFESSESAIELALEFIAAREEVLSEIEETA